MCLIHDIIHDTGDRGTRLNIVICCVVVVVLFRMVGRLEGYRAICKTDSF